MAINQFQGLPAGITGIAQALDMLGSVYKMKQASSANDLMKQEIAKNQAQANLLAEQQKTQGPLAERARASEGALLDYAKKYGIGDQKSTDTRKAQVAGLSAYDIANDPYHSMMLELVKGAQAAEASKYKTEATVAPKEQAQVGALSDKFEQHPVIQASNQALGKLNEAKNTLDQWKAGKVKMTLPKFNEIQTAVASGLSGGGAPTEGTQERNTISNAATTLAGLRQRLDKGLVDINSPELINDVDKSVDQTSYGLLSNRLSTAERLGRDLNPQKNSHYQTVIDNRIKSYRDELNQNPAYQEMQKPGTTQNPLAGNAPGAPSGGGLRSLIPGAQANDKPGQSSAAPDVRSIAAQELAKRKAARQVK